MVTKINTHYDVYHTDIAYECQDKPMVSVSVSEDCDTGIMERFESDL